MILPAPVKSLFAASALALAFASAVPAFAADTYTLDARHTAVVFQYTHMGFSHPTGKFMNAVGTVTLDDADPASSHVEVSFDISGVNTGVPGLDEHLKSPDFFDAAKYPTATFKSTRVEVLPATDPSGKPSRAKVTGDLTIHGVTRPVTLDVTLNSEGPHPMSKKKAAGFTASTTINRSDFGMTMLIPMVSDQIDISIEAEASVQ